MAVSNCESCSHYHICKYKDVCAKETEEKRKLDIVDLPDFITPSVSLICNRQDFESPKNVKYIRLGYHNCDSCKHSEVCKNKEGYQNIEDMLKENKTYFELRCPYWSRKEVAE